MAATSSPVERRRPPSFAAAWLAAAIAVLLGIASLSARRGPEVETLRSTGALSALALNSLQEPTTMVTTARGDALVLDRRRHTVMRIARDGSAATSLLQIGYEPGRLLQPAALSMGREDIFAVMDAPNGLQRIQYFAADGMLISGFYLPIKGQPMLIVDGQVLSGAGSMSFTGRTFLVNEPAWGTLFAELDTTGKVVRQIGTLRTTGYETTDPALHLALNTGLALPDPTGGFYFVFQTGLPIFRKYDASGALVFERHIEGPELDGHIQSLPTTYRPRPDAHALPPALIRTASVDGRGRLWISLDTPFTYVYDPTGYKTRVVQFMGAKVVAPSSFFFKADGHVLVGPDGYEFLAQ